MGRDYRGWHAGLATRLQDTVGLARRRHRLDQCRPAVSSAQENVTNMGLHTVCFL